MASDFQILLLKKEGDPATETGCSRQLLERLPTNALPGTHALR